MTARREPLRLVSVLTRRDDEPGEGAATLARYAAAGHEVMVVTCTGDATGGDGVSEVLGAGHHRLGYAAFGRPGGTSFASVPVAEPTERLVRVLREFRPHVVVAHDDTADPGPDRVRCREVSVAAFDAAGDAARFPGAGEAWQPGKLYTVHEWSEARMRALHEALLARDLESPYRDWLAAPSPGTRWITTRVPCGEFFPVRDRVLRAYAGFLAPAVRHRLAVPVHVRQAVWPTEDFELARCHVPTSLPEDDLLAGISPQ
ncbi:PIG-L deacetylase family protein [Actinophytocola oryzae]|uniref:Mycothiol S-conjugate amidase n=1 Tax=Actinophytocola oryzae TaxID=502181 RepID=A0A4R7UWD2_9PSEU|nr:mycothiol conjugate amidase Mca [Actinophytocola oryzae]TDV41093.1 mycothiol S-conjugate amidase [Actinophytocola oryzae]